MRIFSAPALPLRIVPEEEGTLAEYLRMHSTFDLHGAVGLMHAVASSPTRIPFATWQQVIEPAGTSDERVVFDFHRLLCTAGKMVESELRRRRPFPPPAHDARACSSFARGYLAGLDLWPASVRRIDLLRCAAWACALGGRLDLLPPGDRVQFRLTDEGRAALRAEIGAFVLLTHDLYALGARAVPLRPIADASPARNRPCPCGSGKKFKRCCVMLDS